MAAARTGACLRRLLRAISSSTPSGPGATSGAAAAATPARRSRMVRVGVALGLVALGGAAFAGFRHWRARRADPIAELPLPASVTSIASEAVIDESGASMPATLAGSTYATLCGGTDVWSVLRNATGHAPDDVRALGVLTWGSDADVRDGLTCGTALARATGDNPKFYVVHFRIGDEDASVGILNAPGVSLTWPANQYSGHPGYCQTQEGSSSCLEDGLGAYHVGSRWVFGRHRMLNESAREDSSDRGEPSTNALIVSELYSRLADADETTVWPRPSEIGWGLVCARSAPFENALEFVTNCMPSDQERTFDSILAKTRGFAVQRDSVVLRGRISVRYVFLAHDEQAAEELERAANDLRRDWSSFVTNREGALTRLVPTDSNKLRDQIVRISLPSFLRAMREMRVERNGDLVTLKIERQLSDHEREELTSFQAARTRELAAGSRVVDALRSGQAMPVADLALFVGREVAEEMVAPRATAGDCASFRAHADQVMQSAIAAGTVVPEDFGVKLVLDRALADDQCVGTILTSAYASCLRSAPSVSAIVACSNPNGTNPSGGTP